MSKFNLKTYQKINSDEHIDHKLQESHKNAPEQINEAQLETYRALEPEESTERLLEKSRQASNLSEADEITEKRMNDSKSKLASHRNPSAYKGDINKLEEKRLANDPVENEKYSEASETPKKFRWWEQPADSMGLKLAKSKPGIRTAQLLDDEDEFEVEELEFDRPRFESPEATWEENIAEEIEDIAPKYDVGDMLREFEIEETDVPEVDLHDMFDEINYGEKDVAGTPMAVGAVQVSSDMQDADRGFIVEKALEYISEMHPHLEISENSLGLSELNDGRITFMVTAPVERGSSLEEEDIEIDEPVFAQAQSDIKKK